MVYCTKDEIRAFNKITYEDLGYANETAFNTFLDSLILQVQGLIENYCNAPLGFFDAAGKAFTNQLYDYRYPWIDLRYYPIVTISKVEYNDQGYGIAANWVTLAAIDYILNLDTGQLMLVNKTPAIPEQSVRVSYTAGYAAVPTAVKHVCIQICTNTLQEILQRKVNPVNRIDDFSLKVIFPDVFTKELQMMLTPFTRKIVACG